MTIKPGEEWARALPEPVTATVLESDAALSAAVAADGLGPFAVAAGDLHRAIGAPTRRSFGYVVPIDALEVVIDGHPHLAVAHVIARRPGRLGWWRGPITAVCNVDYIGHWNVAPRAHPNDGRADLVEVSEAMGVRARWQASRRLAQGTHVPHPAITTRSVRHAELRFDRPLAVWIDGVLVAERVTTLRVAVRPDAFELYV